MQQFSVTPAIPRGPDMCSTFQTFSYVVLMAHLPPRKTAGPGQQLMGPRLALQRGGSLNLVNQMPLD